MLGIFKAPDRESRLLLLFVAVLFAVGVLFGTVLASSLPAGQQQSLGEELSVFMGSLSAGSGPDPAAAFWSALWLHGRWLLAIWLLGLTVVGLPFILALDFFKGVLVGFAIGTLVSQLSWRGFAFSLLSVVPPNLIGVPAYLAVSSASIAFSLYVIRNRFIRRKGSLLPPAAALAGTAAAMFLVLAAASAVDAWLSPSLMRWAADWAAASLNH